MSIPVKNSDQWYLGLRSSISELLGIELLWSDNGCLPEYLSLVCGLFHNDEP